MSDILHRELEVPCSAREAWEQLLDPTWLGEDGELPVTPGAEGWVGEGDVVRYLVVEEVDEAARYVYRWATFEDPPSRVEIDLEPTDAGTRIIITESPIDVRAQASLLHR